MIRNYSPNERAEWIQDTEIRGYEKYQGPHNTIFAFQGKYENRKGTWQDGEGGFLEVHSE